MIVAQIGHGRACQWYSHRAIIFDDAGQVLAAKRDIAGCGRRFYGIRTMARVMRYARSFVNAL
jgi:hypothetical protein